MPRTRPDESTGHSARDDAIALALARGMGNGEAASLAGVSERTVTRRMADPGFRTLVNRLRARILDRSVGKLADVTDRAIEKLIRLLDDEESIVQFRAAKAILDQTVKLGAYYGLVGRLDEVEARLEAEMGPPDGRHSNGGF